MIFNSILDNLSVRRFQVLFKFLFYQALTLLWFNPWVGVYFCGSNANVLFRAFVILFWSTWLSGAAGTLTGLLVLSEASKVFPGHAAWFL